jgi:hypothetical protein
MRTFKKCSLAIIVTLYNASWLQTFPLANAPPVGLSLMIRSPSGVFKMMAPIPIMPVADGGPDAGATAPAYIAEDGTSGFDAWGEDCAG